VQAARPRIDPPEQAGRGNDGTACIGNATTRLPNRDALRQICRLGNAPAAGPVIALDTLATPRPGNCLAVQSTPSPAVIV